MKFPAAPLPVPNPTVPYWLSQALPRLCDIGKDDELPSYAHTVIIGSGITGALIADGLRERGLLSGESNSTIMLEARSLCSGASGRNGSLEWGAGGHIKPDRYKSFKRQTVQYGEEQASRLSRFEEENRKDLVNFIKRNNLEEAAELIETRAVDIFMNKDAWVEASESLDALIASKHGHSEGLQRFYPERADEEFRFEGIHGAVSYPACTLWPYKLVTSILDRAICAGLKVFTHTPALEISPAKEADQWLIRTARGTVRCSRIFHATNGYSSKLLSEYVGKIVPVKGHVVALDPGVTWKTKHMGHSAGIQWGEDFDYMIQRETDGAPLIYGGRDLAHPRGFLAIVGDADDSKVTPEIVEALQKFPDDYMKGWDRRNSKLRYAWSGIMGFTADELPFVGQVPGRIGQYISAGYNGHGMARVFLTVKGLLQVALGEDIDPRIPKVYFDQESRLQDAGQRWKEVFQIFQPNL